MSRRKIIILRTFLVLIAGMLPVIPITVVPPWRIQVINGIGEPLVNQPMRQSWDDYSLEFFSFWIHEEDTTTDVNGYVEFSERIVRISLFSLVIGKLRDITPQINPHSSYGKSSFVLCLDKTCRAFWREGESLPTQIVYK
jgi:hypothetical protein